MKGTDPRPLIVRCYDGAPPDSKTILVPLGHGQVQ